MEDKKVLVLRMRDMVRMSQIETETLYSSLSVSQERVFCYPSMLIYPIKHDSIFVQFPLASVETCLYDRGMCK